MPDVPRGQYRGGRQASEYEQLGLPMADQLLGMAGSEGAPAAQQIDRFQERRLAAAVIPRDQIQAGMRARVLRS